MAKAKPLSKSKLVAYRQCPKRVWLEVNHPELREDSTSTEAKFTAGYEVGDISRQLYDPRGKGVLLDALKDGWNATFDRTLDLLGSSQPIFEAGFRTDEALAFADVMLPVKKGGQLAWKMVEVKSSTSVKDYHLDDTAIQVFLARENDVNLAKASIACIDNAFVYQGDGDYTGLLRETDVTEESIGREDEVRAWITDAHRIVSRKQEPKIKMGPQCSDPFECGFRDYCQSQAPKACHPLDQLPGQLSRGLKALIEEKGVSELKDVPDKLLNSRQQRVKKAAITNTTFFDRKAAKQALEGHRLPAYFMDFETINPAVPIWKGTRPYQQIPFQFSVHRLSRTGKLEHRSFLDISGNDPSLVFARALIDACGSSGPIFAYNAGFEKARIEDLALRFPRLAKELRALNARVVDLLPIARGHYYHPSQQGSWSIKAVLPTLCPDLDYSNLDGVQEGGMAMEAYREALAPDTTKERRAEIERQLLAYCALDTLALVRLWSIFSESPLSTD